MILRPQVSQYIAIDGDVTPLCHQFKDDGVHLMGLSASAGEHVIITIGKAHLHNKEL